MKPRPVLHVRVVRGEGGGPDKTILNSPRFLEEAGYPMRCAYLRHPRDARFSALEQQARRWGAEIVGVDDHGPLDWRLVERLRGLCNEFQPRIWHGHDYKSNLLGLLLRRRHPMRLVTTVHGWVHYTWKTPLYYAIDRLCLRRYDAVICVSTDLYETCLRLGIPQQRCRHVPNAIDTDEYKRRESAASARKRLGMSTDRLVVGAVGRLSAEKGFRQLVLAIGRLTDLAVELWIVGAGDQRSDLARLIEDGGLSDRVRLFGFRSDLPDLYTAMDVFALSSLREGLPNALLEAMAFELPTVCTTVAGVSGLVRHRENGLLVEPGSVEHLSEQLRLALQDADLRQRLGRAARETVVESHDLGRRMERVRAIYDQTMENG